MQRISFSRSQPWSDRLGRHTVVEIRKGKEVKEIARLKRYAPESTDRYADAMETLNALIADARRLVRE